MNEKLFVKLGLGAIGLAILLCYLSPGSRIYPVTVKRQNISNVRQLALCLYLYAEDHEGMYPADLRQLAPDYVPNFNLLLYSAEDIGKTPNPKFDWLYFAAGRAKKSAPRIIIASPQAVSEGNAMTRVVVYSNMSASRIEEEKYQRELREMIEDVKRSSAKSLNP